MFKKFVSITNVGKFTCCKAAKDVEFKRLTLLYGENGRGKTTLCDILRSLADSNHFAVLGRSTLGQTEEPTIEVLLNDGTASFKTGQWSRQRPGILVYDSRFIHENVFAGEEVDLEHRRNLYHVIVGSDGVRLVQELSEVDSESRAITKSISEEQRLISADIKGTLPLERFLELEEIPDIDALIEEQQGTVKALESSSDVCRHPELTKIVIPPCPQNIKSILARQLNDLSEDAESKVKAHLASHLPEGGETWISEGVKFVNSSNCPFCSQDISHSGLIAAYKGYFSSEYEKLCESVEELGQGANGLASEASLQKIEHTLVGNETSKAIWEPYVQFSLPDLDANSLKATLLAFHSALSSLILAKSKNPLSIVTCDATYQAAYTEYHKLIDSINAYNAAVDNANSQILTVKEKLKAGNLVAERNKLNSYLLCKRRFDHEMLDRCNNYLALLKKKEELTAKKEEVKANLDTYSANIFGMYQKKINDYLEMFGAEFRIAKTERSYTGGKASSSYSLVINDIEVPLDAPQGQPKAYFGNTLSAGDKSTLALAFFLAYVQNEKDLSSKIVVFDDPFNSQDKFRRSCTQQIINKIAHQAEQVIVLSHSTDFLKMVWQGAGNISIKTLQLFRLGDNSVISEWNIEDETRGDYFNNHALLTNYVRDGVGDRKSVAQSIRLLLEGYLRFKLPGHFSSSEWLGNMIEKIRICEDDDSVLSYAKRILDDLTDLNDYSKRYHHTTNPSVDSEVVDDSELKTFSKRALKLVGNF